MAYLLLACLIWMERNAWRGRWVFPLLLMLFVLQQVPIYFGMTHAGARDAFARWYLGLPLT